MCIRDSGDADPDDDAESLRRTDPAADQATLAHRHQVRDGGSQGGKHRVEARLHPDPADDDGDHRRREGQPHQARRADERPADDPRQPPPEARDRPVRYRPEQRVADDRDQGPDPGERCV